MQCSSEKFQPGQIEILTENREGINTILVNTKSVVQIQVRSIGSAIRRAFNWLSLLLSSDRKQIFSPPKNLSLFVLQEW